MIFDGKKFAQEIEEQVKVKVAIMARKPKIVSVLVGNDPASELYTKLKKAAAERVGIQFEVAKLEITNNQAPIIKQTVEKYGMDESVTGLMVQLPIPGVSRKEAEEIIQAILLSKDVDGLRWRESGVRPATVRAVLSILEGIADTNLWNKKFVVLGSRGAVGEPLVYFLKQRGVQVSEVEWDTPEPTRRVLEGEVVISCVGKAGLVTGEMIAPGAIVVDVGMSQKEGKIAGDMTEDVYQKASVAVPVPGGVGPVTIAALLKNAVEICLR